MLTFQKNRRPAPSILRSFTPKDGAEAGHDPLRSMPLGADFLQRRQWSQNPWQLHKAAAPGSPRRFAARHDGEGAASSVGDGASARRRMAGEQVPPGLGAHESDGGLSMCAASRSIRVRRPTAGSTPSSRPPPATSPPSSASRSGSKTPTTRGQADSAARTAGAYRSSAIGAHARESAGWEAEAPSDPAARIDQNVRSRRGSLDHARLETYGRSRAARLRPPPPAKPESCPRAPPSTPLPSRDRRRCG